MAQKFHGLQYISSYPDLIEAFGADGSIIFSSAGMKDAKSTPSTRSST